MSAARLVLRVKVGFGEAPKSPGRTGVSRSPWDEPVRPERSPPIEARRGERERGRAKGREKREEAPRALVCGSRRGKRRGKKRGINLLVSACYIITIAFVGTFVAQ